MAKKKRKKHNFKYAAPPAIKQSAVVTPLSPPKVESKDETVGANPAIEADSFAYVRRDLMKVGTLAASFVAFEIVLWYLFNHTGLGPAVYNLIKF